MLYACEAPPAKNLVVTQTYGLSTRYPIMVTMDQIVSAVM